MTKVLMTMGLPSDRSHEQSANIEFANSIRCYSDPRNQASAPPAACGRVPLRQGAIWGAAAAIGWPFCQSGSRGEPPGTPRVYGAFLHALRAYQVFGRHDQDGAGRDRVAIWLSGTWNSDNREWGRLLTGAALFASAAMTGWNHRQRLP